jgi:hypothetical protein
LSIAALSAASTLAEIDMSVSKEAEFHPEIVI